MTPEQIAAGVLLAWNHKDGQIDRSIPHDVVMGLHTQITTALRTARNEALEEAALYVDSYEGSRFGIVADNREIACWLRELKHKDGQP
jgi:hypothetical protein